MAMEWSNEKVITFLEILQTEPCLWDPKLEKFKSRGMQSDAWRRIMESLPFKTSIEGMKKKKESLMGYYRTHLNRIKKFLKSGAGKDEVYTTNWFAFETMDNFLRGVYDSSRTLNTETHDDNMGQERSEVKCDGNNNNPQLSMNTEEVSQNIQEENGSRPRENKYSQKYGRKRQVRDELPQEIKAARRQMDETFEFMKEKKDDEYEMFGRLLANRLKQQSSVPQYSTTQSPPHSPISPSSNPPTYQSSPGHSTSPSPRHQAFIPSSNPPTYQSPPGHSTSPSPRHQAFSPSSNPPTHQSPLAHSTSLSPRHQAFSSSSNPPTYQSPPGHSTSPSPRHQAFSPSSNPPTYQSPPGHSTSPSPRHQAFSPSSNSPTHQSPLAHSTSLSPRHQTFSPSPNPPTYHSPLDHSTSLSPHQQAFRSSPNPIPTYQSPLSHDTN
ncbi:pollen-specific leucine-rich repeat extensin-like protein 2 [Vanessa atalanta]|uniref:pollen-specific leucine-rich repeat extensin-like protein 2 n=1 Tax=Vanessa atalanta TaxID=42275 RepID=UPI001FCDAE6E|nr:pollen-specific leucine-rich repeat extensin-like protein 2 [Vanessa atalanta]